MKNSKIYAIALLLGTSIMYSSCIGTFPTFNKVASWNRGITGNKFVNELVFIGLHIIPVYEIVYLADGLIFNSIEFWSGKSGSAVASVGETKRMKGSNGDMFAVTRTEDGYKIVDETRNEECKLVFNEKKQTWNAVINGESFELMTMNEDGTITLNLREKGKITVNADAYGVDMAQAEAGIRNATFDMAAR